MIIDSLDDRARNQRLFAIAQHRGRSGRGATGSARPLVASVAGRQPVPARPKSKLTMPSADDAQLAIAAHEAGHAVVGVLVGAQLRSAEVFCITDAHGRDGICSHYFDDIAVKQKQHLIAAAGPIAEAMFRHGQRPTSAQIAARLGRGKGSDREELQRFAFATGEPLVPAGVLPLVLWCWPAIATLAAQMISRGPAEHADVVAALGLSPDRHRHAFELANIRAGLRGVPDHRDPRR